MFGGNAPRFHFSIIFIFSFPHLFLCRVLFIVCFYDKINSVVFCAILFLMTASCPPESFHFDADNLLYARCDSAQDTLGMKYKHLRVLIKDDKLWSLFVQFTQAFAWAEEPDGMMQAIRLGQLTVLQKDNKPIRDVTPAVHRQPSYRGEACGAGVVFRLIIITGAHNHHTIIT